MKKAGCVFFTMVFLLSAYLCPLVWLIMIVIEHESTPMLLVIATYLILAIPLVIGILAAAIFRIGVGRSCRKMILRCSVIIKFVLIPMYGLIILLYVLYSRGPFLLLVIVVYMYATMLGGSVFSLSYLYKAQRDEIHGKAMSKVGKVMQFIPVLDLISLIIIGIRDRR